MYCHYFSALVQSVIMVALDLLPRRITFDEWGEQFTRIPDELIQEYHYYRPATGVPYPWSTYLFPPQSFAIYGSRHLRRLKFDNSLAALRLWGFVMNETERLFRARQIGRQVIATLGDLGGTPPLVLAAGNTVPFYPDCTWWVPFMNESTVLFEAAARLGIGEAACYSRAALGAFLKGAYFPEPQLCIAATGASCDDFAAVESLVAKLGKPVHWFELPLRKDAHWGAACEEWRQTPAGTTYQGSALRLLINEFQALRQCLQSLLGVELSDERIRQAIQRVNRVRRTVKRIKELVYSAPASVFPALEMMLIEFGNLHYYSDIDEWTAILEHLEQTISRRVSEKRFLASGEELRIIWVTPPADPLLLCYAEDLSLRVVGTEYVIGQALELIPETGDPLTALAETLLNASLIGSSRSRAADVIAQAQRYHAEGVIISGIFGGSHCASETHLIRDYITQELDLPVLAFDVPAPAKSIQSQVKTRIEAFVELLKSRRRN